MTSYRPRSWDRRGWGVEFRTARQARPTLLGAWWATTAATRYVGEPSHPLLFTSRVWARRWCEAQQTKYALRAADDCRHWRFRAVRVRETVRKVGR